MKIFFLLLTNTLEFEIVSNVLPDLEIIKLTKEIFFYNLILVVNYLQK